MHIYFSGIGGVAIGPLAEIAKEAGHDISGSDIASSRMTEQLEQRGIRVMIGQSGSEIAKVHAAHPIDWLVISSAVPLGHPEVQFARAHGIKTTKRAPILNRILADAQLKLVAISGTHGKTTTTAMLTWLFMQFGLPVSYSIGTRVSFGPSGAYQKASRYFVYECDEYDRNMLEFHPTLSIITPVDYDHPDIYPTQQDYDTAFRQFITQSESVIMWNNDAARLQVQTVGTLLLDTANSHIAQIALPGAHYRQNAWAAANALHKLFPTIALADITKKISAFPGTERRFEQLAPGVYSFYSHHPAEIRADLQQVSELSSNIVVVYQPHQNIRQHEIIAAYKDCFASAQQVYWLPTYLSREQPGQAVLTPEQLIAHLANPAIAKPAELDDHLARTLRAQKADSASIVFMGAGSIDEWARNFAETL